LEEFIQYHSPNWDWRTEAQIGEVEDRRYQRENERLAKVHADDARWGMAVTSKWYTPEVPDACGLLRLAWEWRSKKPTREKSGWKHQRFIRRTWPTLRELKLATAIPEKTLRKIIRNLRPKKTEMTRASRHGSKRGAVPLRFGPRLVVGVLDEFVNRLPEFPIDNEEKKRLRKIATQVKRAFVARLGPSRSST
jgi:hypothetical protein